MPEKSGIDAPPLAGPVAGVTVCAPAGIAAPAANATNKRKSRLMISSVQYHLPMFMRVRTLAQTSE